MKTAILWGVVLLVLFMTGSLCGQAIWHDDAQNPHLAFFAPSLSPSVLYDSSSHRYHLWTTDGAAVYHAISFNAKKWFVSENISFALDATFSMNYFYAVEVVRVDTLYYMYFSGQISNGKLVIGLATSRDGENWTKHPSSPVLSGAGVTWEARDVVYPKVVHNSQGFLMSYAGGNGQSASVGIASSQDGIHWTRFGGNPVVLPKDSVSGITPCALTIKDGVYYLLYNSLTAPVNWIRLAISTDGYLWKKSGATPLILSGQTGSWNSGNLGEGCLRYVDGVFHLWYSATSSSQSVWKMGYAWTDSLNIDTLNATGSIRLTDPEVPGRFQLDQNYPNPFNPTTTIGFQVPATAFVQLNVFDDLGRHVATLASGRLHPGVYETTFDASGLGTGVYICQLRSGEQIQSRKMILTK